MYAKGTDKIIDRREQLRVKVNSLAEEARIIRKAEAKAKGRLREELYFHRIFDVRAESRSAAIALGLIKGRTWEQMEPNTYRSPNWERVKALIKKYGPVSKESQDVLLALPCFQTKTHSFNYTRAAERIELGKKRNQERSLKRLAAA